MVQSCYNPHTECYDMEEDGLGFGWAGDWHRRFPTAGSGMTHATSHTHPIRVATRALDGATGWLGLTHAPGKRSASMVCRVVWDRDLEADLAALRTRFFTDVLVSLIEDQEFELLSIPNLVERGEAHGMRVRRFPIRAMSVPKADEAESFAALIRELHECMVAGKNVTVHCRGGLGRTGLVAACVLVRNGVAADTAIRRVRAAQPGALEITAQGHYVRAFARRNEHMVTTDAALLDLARTDLTKAGKPLELLGRPDGADVVWAKFQA